MSGAPVSKASVLTDADARVLSRIIGLGDAVTFLCFRSEDFSLADRTGALEAVGETIADLARDLADRVMFPSDLARGA